MTGVRVAIAVVFGVALGAAPAVAQAPDGEALYRQNCRLCHGATGKPSTAIKAVYKKIPTITDPAFLGARSDDSLLAVLTNGAGKDMKPFKGKLSHDEMVAVVKYVRQLTAAKTP